jgi:hypothetical protein
VSERLRLSAKVNECQPLRRNTSMPNDTCGFMARAGRSGSVHLHQDEKAHLAPLGRVVQYADVGTSLPAPSADALPATLYGHST